uniref:Uncharacterized protein n=1 Tax=Xenopus tropicalis TaxID=8364 RepID=A0A1B8YAN0_XENTR
MELDSVDAIAKRRILCKVQSIVNNPSHPLYSVFAEQKSSFSQRLITFRCSTERHRRSFLPTAIKIYNSSLSVFHTHI